MKTIRKILSKRDIKELSKLSFVERNSIIQGLLERAMLERRIK